MGNKVAGNNPAEMDITLDVPKMDIKIESSPAGKVAVMRVPLNLVNPPVTKSGKSYMVAAFSDVRGEYRFNGSVYRTIPKDARK